MEIEIDILRRDDEEPPLHSRMRNRLSGFTSIFKVRRGRDQLKFNIRGVISEVNTITIAADLAQFIWAIMRFVISKVKGAVLLAINLIKASFAKSASLKLEIQRKLIWGRGRLGRPASHFSVLGLSSMVFVFGGLLPGTSIVQNKISDYEFLPIGGDVLAATNIAVTEISNRPNTESTKYIVAEGDTLTSIGQKYNITVDAIRYVNNLTDLNYLKIGQELIIPPVEGVIYEVKGGDTIESLAEKFAVATQAIVDFNYLDEPFELSVGQKLVIPNAQIPKLETERLAQRPATPTYPSYDVDAYTNIPYSDSGIVGTGKFVWPTNSRFISQYFSWYHPALDITKDSPIYAADSGVVVRAGWWPNGYGYAVQLDHGNGYITTYAHMRRIDVSVGGYVEQGQVLGQMGSTGRSTGTHVHFVIQYYGQYINPLNFF